MDVLDVAQATELLGVSERRVRQLAATGQLELVTGNRFEGYVARAHLDGLVGDHTCCLQHPETPTCCCA